MGDYLSWVWRVLRQAWRDIRRRVDWVGLGVEVALLSIATLFAFLFLPDSAGQFLPSFFLGLAAAGALAILFCFWNIALAPYRLERNVRAEKDRAQGELQSLEEKVDRPLDVEITAAHLVLMDSSDEGIDAVLGVPNMELVNRSDEYDVSGTLSLGFDETGDEPSKMLQGDGLTDQRNLVTAQSSRVDYQSSPIDIQLEPRETARVSIASTLPWGLNRGTRLFVRLHDLPSGRWMEKELPTEYRRRDPDKKVSVSVDDT